MVANRGRLVPWKDHIRDGRVAVHLTFSPDTVVLVTAVGCAVSLLFQVNVCGSKEKTAFPENSRALDKNDSRSEHGGKLPPAEVKVKTHVHFTAALGGAGEGQGEGVLAHSGGDISSSYPNLNESRL